MISHRSTSSLPTDEGYRIEFNDLRLKLPTGEVIMRGPSGALEPGKTTAIMGASASRRRVDGERAAKV